MVKDPIQTALSALKQGQTLLYPTDTIWGIGCDALDVSAIERVYAIKERDHSKSMLILVASDMLSPDVSQEVKTLLLESDRPTTVVVPARYVMLPLPVNLLAVDGTVGVRVPKMDFCQELLRQLGRPIVSTSANLSGHPSPGCYADIAEELKRRVDCCLPDLPEFRHIPTGSSRVLKVNPDGLVTIIRE